jgi:hypothetical protein
MFKVVVFLRAHSIKAQDSSIIDASIAYCYSTKYCFKACRLSVNIHGKVIVMRKVLNGHFFTQLIKTIIQYYTRIHIVEIISHTINMCAKILKAMPTQTRVKTLFKMSKSIS